MIEALALNGKEYQNEFKPDYLENEILIYLSQNEDKDVYLEFIYIKFKNYPKTKIKYHLEKLLEHKFINQYFLEDLRAYSYKLLPKGRKYLVENNLI